MSKSAGVEIKSPEEWISRYDVFNKIENYTRNDVIGIMADFFNQFIISQSKSAGVEKRLRELLEKTKTDKVICNNSAEHWKSDEFVSQMWKEAAKVYEYYEKTIQQILDESEGQEDKVTDEEIIKAADKFASNHFSDKSSFEFHTHYESFMAGAKHILQRQENKGV